MDANHTTYTYTVNINVHDDTGEIHAHVRGEGFGSPDSLTGSGPMANVVDTLFATRLGAAIAAGFIRDHHGINAGSEDALDALDALAGATAATRDKPITDFTDKELADMVRQSAYLRHTVMGEEQRFLLVLAVPYGKADHVTTEEAAFEGFFDLVRGDDYAERNLVVYDHEDGTTYVTSLETIRATDEEVEAMYCAVAGCFQEPQADTEYCVIHTGDGSVYACQNCDWTGPEAALQPIKNIHERVDHGERMPAGECPECGALCHRQEVADEAAS